MLVPCEGEKGIPPIHQITGDEGVRIHNGRQGVGSRASDETDHKEDLFMFLHGGVQLLREVIGHIRHAWLLLVAPTKAALVFAGFLIILLFSIFAVSLCHICAFIAGVFLSLSLFLFLFQFLNALFQNIGPEITLKVRQFLCTC